MEKCDLRGKLVFLGRGMLRSEDCHSMMKRRIDMKG